MSEERVKVGFTLERKQTTLLRVLAKYLGITQGEVLGMLLDRAKKNLRNVAKELKQAVEEERKNELENVIEEF